MACHCRNRGKIAEGRRLEFKRNHVYENLLKEEENLASLD